MMKKALIIFIGCFALISTVNAQQKDFEWRIGASGGYTNYYGDLSPFTVRGFSNWDAIKHVLYYNENYFDQYSFKINIEKQLSPTVGLMFSYGQYQFSMSDRYIRRDGSLYQNNPNFGRALNFQNDTKDVGMALVFKADNDILLPSTSLLAPYFTLGFGLINFETKGDLLDSEGNPYNYASGNVVTDGVYETDLTSLNTELENGYDLGAFYTNLGLGIRLRLGSRLELFAQSDFLYTFTDYLDDVSGEYRDSYDNSFQAYAAQPGTNTVDADNYRGNPNNRNDWIIYHGIGLKFNFGASKKTFSAPRLSTFYPTYTSSQDREATLKDQEIEEKEIKDSIQTAEKPATGNTYNYFMSGTTDSRQISRLSERLQLLEWDQQIQQREAQLQASGIMKENLSERRKSYESRYQDIQADTVLALSDRDSLLEISTQDRFNVRYSLDSLDRRQSELKSDIDSLGRLKTNFYLPSNRFDRDAENDNLQNWQTRPDSLNDSLLYPRKEPFPAARPESGRIRRDQAGDTALYSSAAESGQILNQRLFQLETENQRLRRAEDSLRSVPRESIYLSPYYNPNNQYGQQQTRSYTQSQSETTNQSESQYQESETRRRRWRPLAGIFGGRKDIRDDRTYPGRVSRVISPPVIENETTGNDAESLALGINNTLLGTAPDSVNQTGVDNLRTHDTSTPTSTTQPAERVVKPAEIVRDTVFVEKESDIRLLESKIEVYFDVNQNSPAREEVNKLAPLVDFVKNNETYRLSLIGFSDNTGNVSYNLRLIQNRIESVAEILKDQFGLEENQILTESGGQVVRGPNRSGNDIDRKVEVRIVPRN